jgi:hypothetical protein
MKLILMKKTMAGPSGVLASGMQKTVSEELAAQLVAADAAEIIAHVADISIEVLTPDRETAMVSGPMEKAIQAKAAPKRTKKG